MNEITRDCVASAIQLLRCPPTENLAAEPLHQRLRDFVERASARALELGLPSSDADAIGYAFAALLDEIALGRGGELRTVWLTKPLQVALYRENTAGDGFFLRLESLLADEGRTDVLRVYDLCLSLGFQGRYRVRGGEVERMHVVDRVHAELARRGATRMDRLSPHGTRPRERRSIRRAVPIIAMATGALLVGLLVYAGLRRYVGSRAEDVAALAERSQPSQPAHHVQRARPGAHR